MLLQNQGLTAPTIQPTAKHIRIPVLRPGYGPFFLVGVVSKPKFRDRFCGVVVRVTGC
jgi:hypothetical protein